MTLEQAWHLLELLNENANQKSKDFWLSADFNKAVCYQSSCFKKNLLELDETRQKSIQYWIENDDEFLDYFKCLAGDE